MSNIDPRAVVSPKAELAADVTVGAYAIIGDEVRIGAGTTVWKDTPPGGLVINTKTQEHRSGWKRPIKKNH